MMGWAQLFPLALALVMALVTTALKVWIIAAPRPDIYGTGNIDRPVTTHGEEFPRGNIALEIRVERTQPLQELRCEEVRGLHRNADALVAPELAKSS